jgi:RNA polymerase sigma factor (sigma-70 family)
VAASQLGRGSARPAQLSRCPLTSSTALGELSPEHRAVVVLRFVCDYTPGEIARALDMPRGTVNSRLRRALDRLGEVIER